MLCRGKRQYPGRSEKETTGERDDGAPASDAAQHSRGKQEDGADELQYAAHCDAYHAKRQQKQPHKRIKNQGNQRGILTPIVPILSLQSSLPL